MNIEFTCQRSNIFSNNYEKREKNENVMCTNGGK